MIIQLLDNSDRIREETTQLAMRLEEIISKSINIEGS